MGALNRTGNNSVAAPLEGGVINNFETSLELGLGAVGHSVLFILIILGLE